MDFEKLKATITGNDEAKLEPGPTPPIPATHPYASGNATPPLEDLREHPPESKEPIFISQEGNMVTFQVQDGPIKQVGVNGCQIDDVIQWVRDFIEKAESRVPHIQNRGALKGLKNALYCLNLRTRDRIIRGVEGYDIK